MTEVYVGLVVNSGMYTITFYSKVGMGFQYLFIHITALNAVKNSQSNHYGGKMAIKAFKGVLKWISELWMSVGSQCPNCGYYCTGNTVFCTKDPNEIS